MDKMIARFLGVPFPISGLDEPAGRLVPIVEHPLQLLADQTVAEPSTEAPRGGS